MRTIPEGAKSPLFLPSNQWPKTAAQRVKKTPKKGSKINDFWRSKPSTMALIMSLLS